MQFDMRLGAPRDEAGERVERKGKICSDNGWRCLQRSFSAASRLAAQSGARSPPV
jgi:hypothetical protein